MDIFYPPHVSLPAGIPPPFFLSPFPSSPFAHHHCSLFSFAHSFSCFTNEFIIFFSCHQSIYLLDIRWSYLYDPTQLVRRLIYPFWMFREIVVNLYDFSIQGAV